MLLALVTKHGQLVAARESASRHPSITDITRRFLQCDRKLSAREAEICAMVVVGNSAKEMARITDLSTTSITTYRKRAYQKIRVHDARGLKMYYDSLAATSFFTLDDPL